MKALVARGDETVNHLWHDQRGDGEEGLGGERVGVVRNLNYAELWHGRLGSREQVGCWELVAQRRAVEALPQQDAVDSVGIVELDLVNERCRVELVGRPKACSAERALEERRDLREECGSFDRGEMR